MENQQDGLGLMFKSIIMLKAIIHYKVLKMLEVLKILPNIICPVGLALITALTQPLGLEQNMVTTSL